MALRIVGRLLASRFGDDAIDIAAIEPDQVRDFFAQQAKLYSKPATAGTVIASLRGYFRYRVSLGDAMHGLIGVLSYPANWQLTNTYWYLSAVPELMALAAGRFESFMSQSGVHHA